MRPLTAAAFSLAVLFTAGSLLAQNDGPGGPPGGRRGPPGGDERGGFGPRGGMDRGSLIGLLRMEEVREELKITEEQQAQIREAGEAVRNSLTPPEIDFGSLRDASDEDRQAARAKMQEFGAKLDQESRTKLAGILDETQMQRLQGLWIQRAGALDALNHETVATELKLTDDQKSQLKTQQDEQRSQMRMRGGFGFGGRRRGEGGPPPEAGGPPPEGRGNFFERMQDLRKESDDKALAVLTDEQKAAFEALQGAPFEFPPPQFGGFGRRGRGGDGGDGPPPRRGPGRDAE